MLEDRLSRKNDPVTSHIAAQDIVSSGVFERQKDIVYDFLIEKNMEGINPTSAELAAMGNMDRYTPSRRLPDLEKEGKVKKMSPRTCTVTKKKCVTWFANKSLV